MYVDIICMYVCRYYMYVCMYVDIYVYTCCSCFILTGFEASCLRASSSFFLIRNRGSSLIFAAMSAVPAESEPMNRAPGPLANAYLQIYDSIIL